MAAAIASASGEPFGTAKPYGAASNISSTISNSPSERSTAQAVTGESALNASARSIVAVADAMGAEPATR